eukprot:FR743330.1.p1 GENE.FR743330.1~~FR743330.1.p1  ORF type:complete len:105 (+),score=3.03 FR743330.1:52-366(+)
MVPRNDNCMCSLREANTHEEERLKQEPSISNGETKTSSMNGAGAYARGEERPNAGCLLKRKRMEPTSLQHGRKPAATPHWRRGGFDSNPLLSPANRITASRIFT